MVEKVSEKKRNPWENMLIVFRYVKGYHVDEGENPRTVELIMTW